MICLFFLLFPALLLQHFLVYANSETAFQQTTALALQNKLYVPTVEPPFYLFLSNTNIFPISVSLFNHPHLHIYSTYSAKTCMLHLLFKCSHCVPPCHRKVELEERGTSYWEYRRGILCALSFVQNHPREECRSPSPQTVRKSHLAQTEVYSLQG